MSTESIIAGALDLPLVEQKRLARMLLVSINDVEEDLSDQEWVQAWAPVLARRAQEARNGETALLDADVVLAELAERFRHG